MLQLLVDTEDEARHSVGDAGPIVHLRIVLPPFHVENKFA